MSIHVNDDAMDAARPEPAEQPPSLMPILPSIACVIADQYGLGAVQPLLQFQLTGTSGLTEDEAMVWVGFIMTAQYVGVLIGCLVMGYACDKLGPIRTLQLNIVGDIAFFAITGFVAAPGGLLAVRLFAGFFSPLVPAVANIFAVTSMAQTVQAIGYHGLAVVTGFGVGTASVGLIELMSFKAICLMCSGIAAVALTTTAPPPMCPFNQKPASGVEIKPAPEGVKKALRSPTMITQASTAFAAFVYFQGSQTLVALDLVQRFDFDPSDLSLVLVTAPFWLLLAIFIIPRLAQRFGLPL